MNLLGRRRPQTGKRRFNEVPFLLPVPSSGFCWFCLFVVSVAFVTALPVSSICRSYS